MRNRGKIIEDTYQTTKLGYNKFKESKNNLNKIREGYTKAVDFENKTDVCIFKTILFCLFMITITILVCIFL